MRPLHHHAGSGSMCLRDSQHQVSTNRGFVSKVQPASTLSIVVANRFWSVYLGAPIGFRNRNQVDSGYDKRIRWTSEQRSPQSSRYSSTSPGCGAGGTRLGGSGLPVPERLHRLGAGQGARCTRVGAGVAHHLYAAGAADASSLNQMARHRGDGPKLDASHLTSLATGTVRSDLKENQEEPGALFYLEPGRTRSDHMVTPPAHVRTYLNVPSACRGTDLAEAVSFTRLPLPLFPKASVCRSTHGRTRASISSRRCEPELPITTG